MNSKLVLALIAAVGSAALAASAQTQSSSTSSSDTSTRTTTTAPYTTAAGSASSLAEPVQELPTTTYRIPPIQADRGVRVGTARPRIVADPAAQEEPAVNVSPPRSYSTSTIYGVRPWVARMDYSNEEASIAQEANNLARQLGEAKSDADREKLLTKMGEILGKQFDERQKRHEGEIKELEAQVKKLKDLVSKRQENRREIISKRMEQVVREAQGLGW